MMHLCLFAYIKMDSVTGSELVHKSALHGTGSSHYPSLAS